MSGYHYDKVIFINLGSIHGKTGHKIENNNKSCGLWENTSACGTTTTEHLLNAGRRPQTSQKDQKPEGNLHTEVGPKPKLNPRSCANKEEKGKFLCAASGAAD